MNEPIDVPIGTKRLLFIELLGPVVLSVIFVFYIAFFPQPQLSSELSIYTFLGFVLFGNFAHNSVFIWMLFRIPEFKDWREEYRFYGVRIEWLILFFALVIYILVRHVFALKSVVIYNLVDDWRQQLFIFAVALVNSYHTIAQSRGISYGWSFRLQIAENERVLLHSKERTFSYLYFIFEMLPLALVLFVLKAQLSLEYKYLRSALLIALVAISIAIYWVVSRKSFRVKALHYFRFIPRSLIGVTPLATVMTYALHGWESFFTYFGMTTQSKAPYRRRLAFELGLIYVFLGVLYIVIYSGVLPESVAFEIKPILASIAISHYLSEGFLFRFRNPVTKKYISPLLQY